MAINTGVNVSKSVGYGVLRNPDQVQVSKVVAFAVLLNIYPPQWGSGVFVNGLVSNAYTSWVTLAAGSAPITFTQTSGTLPPGLSLSTSGLTVTLSGTPTTAGTYTFGITATNSYGSAGENSFTVIISYAVGVGGAWVWLA